MWRKANEKVTIENHCVPEQTPMEKEKDFFYHHVVGLGGFESLWITCN